MDYSQKKQPRSVQDMIKDLNARVYSASGRIMTPTFPNARELDELLRIIRH